METRPEDPAPRYGIRPPGYRLPDATALGPVHLQVADLDRSLAYYRRVLGLRTIEPGSHRATLAATDDDTPLVVLTEHPGAAPAPRRGRLGLFHFALLLPDRADLGRFAAHLADTGVRAGSADHLVSEAFYLQDPDGLGIEVYADRPRAAWQQRHGELVMDTLPLDVAALTRAGGGRSWEGMPAGTVVGHVHLHVGDLEKAAAFYHAGLGLDVVVRSYPGALFLSAGGYHHHLGLNTWAGPDAIPPEEGDARLVEWTVVLPNGTGDGAAAGLASAGFSPARTDRGWRVADPWGTALRLVESGTAK